MNCVFLIVRKADKNVIFYIIVYALRQPEKRNPPVYSVKTCDTNFVDTIEIGITRIVNHLYSIQSILIN